MLNLTTYKKIKINPFEFDHIEKLKITKIPNQHSTLFLTGILPEETEDAYVKRVIAEKNIEVLVETEDDFKTIFCGCIKSIEVFTRASTYYIQVEAVSYSIMLDIERVRRTYQNLDMTYNDLMLKSVERFNADIMDKATNGAAIKQFILQYDETPWEFVMRMTSRFNLPIIPEDKLYEPKIYAGLPERKEIGKLNDFTYKVKKEVSHFRTSTENYKASVFEDDFIYYEIFSEEIFEIANKVEFGSETLYVKEAHIDMDEGIFKNVYKLCKKSGFHINKIRNERIIGLSLEGKNIGVDKDNIKIHLDIDKEHPPDDFCWFKYSTPYTSDNGGGFYCMPELHEKVRLYFPDWDDEHAYATSCVREHFAAGGERGNPDIKYWRTIAGKEVMFLPNGIRIRCLDDEIFIYMFDEEGILIQSNKSINLIANEGTDINFYAEGKIIMGAEKEFNAFCNGSLINMRDGITRIRGNQIKDN